MHREKGPALYAAFREGLGELIRNSDTYSGEIKLYGAFVMVRLKELTVEVLISHEGQECHSISFYIPQATPETFRDRFDLALKSLPSLPRLNPQVDNPGIEGVDARGLSEYERECLEEQIKFDQAIREYVEPQMPLFNHYVNRNLASDLRQKIREDAETLFG
jgi:hypothetical protein